MNDTEKIERIKQIMEDYHKGYTIDRVEIDDLDALISIDNILKQ